MGGEGVESGELSVFLVKENGALYQGAYSGDGERVTGLRNTLEIVDWA